MYEALILFVAFVILREFQHRKELERIIVDMQERESLWKKSFDDLQIKLKEDYDRRISLLQEAQGVVWLKLDKNGPSMACATNEKKDTH